MAPEQLGGDSSSITPLVDVYALGVLGFELLTGRLPHEVRDLPISRAIAVLSSADPLRAGTVDAGLRGDLETVLGKALETEPGRRYASAAGLAADLRRFLDDLPIEARPATRTYRALKFARRHQGLVAGAFTTLLALLAGLAASWILLGQARDERDAAKRSELQAVNGLHQSAQVLLDSGAARDALNQLRLIPEVSRGTA